MQFIVPDQGVMEALPGKFPAGVPVVMVNLLRFRDQAQYGPGEVAEPCSGFEAFTRYGIGVTPLIRGIGGEQLWQGRQVAMLIGPQDKDWHLAVLVRYPSAQAFVEMVTSDDYRAVAFHRIAALEDSRLIAMQDL